MGDYVKSECWLFFIFSGGIFLIFRPVWLWMLIPIFMQKFLHDQVQMWGVNDQYCIEFAPIITMGAVDALSGSLYGKQKNIIMALLVISAALVTLRLMDRTLALVPKSKIRIYQQAHWKRDIS
jgi:uncharacterized membrane protein